MRRFHIQIFVLNLLSCFHFGLRGQDVKNEAVSGLKFWPFLLEPPFDRVRT